VVNLFLEKLDHLIIVLVLGVQYNFTRAGGALAPRLYTNNRTTNATRYRAGTAPDR